MSLYLDASVILPTLVVEAASAQVETFLSGATEPLWISEFAIAEVASGLSRLVRMGAMSSTDADAALQDLDAWCAADIKMIEVDGSDARSAVVIVRRFELKLRAPDALHVAICRRLGGQLVTLDRNLGSAAASLGVLVVSP